MLYKNTVQNTDYDLGNVYARYELHGARTDLSVNAGVNRVTEDGGSDSGVSAQVQLMRKISQAAKLTLTAGRDLTDTSASFNAAQNNVVGNAVNVNSVANSAPSAVTSSIYTRTYVAGAWDYERHRTTVGLSAHWERDSYVNQPQYDGSLSRFDATIERKLTQALRAQLYCNLFETRYSHDEFIANSASYSDRDGLYGFALVLREGRGLEIRLRVDHLSRDVSAGIGNGYSENRAFLTIGYRP